MGLMERLAECFHDGRFQPLVEHRVVELVRQRIGALALGYEDLNDHDRLRLDPLQALLAGCSRRVCGGGHGSVLWPEEAAHFADDAGWACGRWRRSSRFGRRRAHCRVR